MEPRFSGRSSRIQVNENNDTNKIFARFGVSTEVLVTIRLLGLQAVSIA